MNNARCPKCNNEFFLDTQSKSVVCPNCGKEIDTLRARKYFAVFTSKAAIDKEAHGEELFRYEDMLRAGAHHLQKQEFTAARQSYEAAVQMNPGDYRCYMGLVAVETQNYTDVKNQTHKKYLQKAINVASEAEQKSIADIYRNYDLKASMTDEEYGEYVIEKQKDFKARVKKAIIGFSKYNDQAQKKAKISSILALCFVAAGAITFVLGLVFVNFIVMMIGTLLIGAAYVPFTIWSKNRYNNRLYEFLVSLFNALVGFKLSFEQTDKTLELMAAVLLSVKDGDHTTRTDEKIADLAEYLVETDDSAAIAFLKGQKQTEKLFK